MTAVAVAVHNHGTEDGEGLACREVLVDGELKGACLREYAERTVTESDPHSFYCPQCRTTYDFPELRAQDCTCQSMQDFIVQHNAGHDTKRPQVNTSVNTDLRALIAAILVDALAADTADQLLAIRYGGSTQAQLTIDCGPLADAVIEVLGLRREWGALDDNDEGVLADARDELKPWGAETVKTRYITDWVPVAD